ncbi:fibroblast growth factor-binding protein 1 [Pogona vitticeps]|nr:fibroblast growth factor-binding protein 1-like [Pogona vitticeps]
MEVRHFALLCALFMFSQLLQAECERQKERKKERANAGKDGRLQSASNNQNGKSKKTPGQKSSLKGKFITKEKFVCTWMVNEAQTAMLKIDCKKEAKAFSCEFSGNPSTCPQYPENRKAFWKQITRSLKNKKMMCQDSKSILKSRLCNKGPPSAHLRLITQKAEHAKQEKPASHKKEVSLTPVTPVTTENQPGKASSECVEDTDYIDQSKVAEEYCSESWLSLCKFFISMIQDKKCQ